MIRKINLTLTIIALTLAILLVFTRNNIVMSKGNAMLEVYSKYDFDVLQVNIKSLGTVNNSKINFLNESELINHIFEILEISNAISIDKIETDNKNIYTFVKDSESAKVIVELENNNTDEIEIKLDIILYENENALLYLQDKIEEVYNSLHSDNTMNITIVGTYNQRFSADETKRVAKRILSCIKSNVIEEYETERLYSAYGYTNLIDDYRKIENEKVNVHIALRYNEYEDKTYLYLASPIISEDY